MTDLFDPQEGERLKKIGRASVAANNKEFLATVRAEARRIAAQFGSVSAADLRQYAKEIDLEPAHPNAWGAVFKGKGWYFKGWEKNTAPSAHARMIRVWEWIG